MDPYLLVRSRAALAALIVAVGACGQEPAPDPSSDAELLGSRPYELDVPKSYQEGVPAPLVVLLHGQGGTGSSIESYYKFSSIQESAGFLYVRPTAPLGWRAGPTHGFPYDFNYLRAVINDMKARFTVDPRRIFVVGFSAGAHMAQRLGCDLSATIAAFVSVAGQVTTVPADCAVSEPVSALLVHGDMDAVIGYHGDVQNDPPDPSVPSAAQSVAVWARNDGCTQPLAPMVPRLGLVTDVSGDETRVEAYGGCPAGIGVELWTMEGAGHHPEVEPSWASHLYGFLAAHPKPPRP